MASYRYLVVGIVIALSCGLLLTGPAHSAPTKTRFDCDYSSASLGSVKADCIDGWYVASGVCKKWRRAMVDWRAVERRGWRDDDVRDFQRSVTSMRNYAVDVAKKTKKSGAANQQKRYGAVFAAIKANDAIGYYNDKTFDLIDLFLDKYGYDLYCL